MILVTKINAFHFIGTAWNSSGFIDQQAHFEYPMWVRVWVNVCVVCVWSSTMNFCICFSLRKNTYSSWPEYFWSIVIEMLQFHLEFHLFAGNFFGRLYDSRWFRIRSHYHYFGYFWLLLSIELDHLFTLHLTHRINEMPCILRVCSKVMILIKLANYYCERAVKCFLSLKHAKPLTNRRFSLHFNQWCNVNIPSAYFIAKWYLHSNDALYEFSFAFFFYHKNSIKIQAAIGYAKWIFHLASFSH